MAAIQFPSRHIRLIRLQIFRGQVMNEEKGDWCIVVLDGVEVRAKIVHKGRGKYRIIEDNKDGKYLTTIVDAEDIIRVEK
jgi:hypothetical protein